MLAATAVLLGGPGFRLAKVFVATRSQSIWAVTILTFHTTPLWLLSACVFIEANADAWPSDIDVAEAVGVDRWQLIQEFRRLLGFTPSEFLHHLHEDYRFPSPGTDLSASFRGWSRLDPALGESGG